MVKFFYEELIPADPGSKFVCNRCGKIFEIRGRNAAKFCCEICKRDWDNRNQRLKKKGFDIIYAIYKPYIEGEEDPDLDSMTECAWCGARFKKNKPNNIYCSALCRDSAKHLQIRKRGRLARAVEQASQKRIDFCRERGIKSRIVDT